MTFNAYETSAAQGEPILLYDFSLGTAHWRYTSADRVITYQGHDFDPHPISRTAPVQSSDVRRQTMRVTASRFITLASLFAQYPPSGDVLLIVTALHYDDPDQQGIVDWVGRIIGPKWKGSSIEFACEPVYTSVQTMGLRRRWGVGCPHVLYGPACTLNKDDFKVPATIESVSGFEVTSSGFVPPGAGLSFTGGFIEWDTGDGYFERRTIDSVSGATLTLSYGSPQLIAGLSVNAYPGCSRNPDNCNAFGNILNYGGQKDIPNKNPMNGSIANPVY